MVELHYHVCPDCGTVWSHTMRCYGSKRWHSCPECGAEQYDGYEEHELSGSEKRKAVRHPKMRARR